jgi:hypothetical protein
VGRKTTLEICTYKSAPAPAREALDRLRQNQMASEFFGKEMAPEEAEERDAWLKMRAEAQKRER